MTQNMQGLESACTEEAMQIVAVTELVTKAGEHAVLWKKEYDKKLASRTLEQFRTNFGSQKKSNLTKQAKAL